MVNFVRTGGVNEIDARLDGAANNLDQLFQMVQKILATPGWWASRKAFPLREAIVVEIKGWQ